MSIIVGEPRITNLSLGDNGTTSWLFDNIGDVVQVEIDFRFQSDYLCQSHVANDGKITFYTAPPSGLTGVIFDSRYLYSDTAVFADWDVGDRISIANDATNTGSRTIIEKVSDQLLLMDASYSGTPNVNNALDIGASVYNSTPINGCEFSHNLIENDQPPTFTSAVDGSLRKAKIDGIDNNNFTPQLMTQLGNKSYQYGDIVIKGNGIGNGPTLVPVAQAFTITQTLIIDPLFLADQIDDIKNDIPPDYFKDQACLKYVFEIQASKESNNPNKKKEVTQGEVLGNSGWTDENFNTQLTNYSIDNVVYRLQDNTVNVGGAIELTENETTVEFDIINTEDAPFSSGNTLFCFLFHILPQPEEEYRVPEYPTSANLAKDRFLNENFLIDRIVGTLGATSTAPDNLGTDIQVIKEMDLQYISNSLARAKVTFEMAPEVVAKISGMGSKDYRITIATQNHLLQRSVTDKVNLRIDVDEFFVQTTDPDMISITTKFLEHPYSDIETQSKDQITARIEDDILATSTFIIDQNGREEDEIVLTGATSEVVFSDGIEEFTADEYTVSLIDSQIVNGIPYVNIEESRGFATPCDDNRANVKLFSRTDLDGGGFFHYQFQFPFIFRWEKWEALPEASDDFFDANEQNEGLNHDWAKYPKLAGWDAYLKVTINATKNGNPQEYVKRSILQMEDYLEGVFWDTENLQSYDNVTNDDLQGLLQAYANSRIEGNKTYVASNIPSVGDLAMQLKINIFEKDNFKAQYTLSSEYDAHPDTIWQSVDNSNRVVIDGSASPIFTAKALTIGDLLQQGQTYKISCRFWDKRPESPFPENESKLLEDGSRKLLEDGGFKILD